MPGSRESTRARILTHLVEVLQQVDYPALNLALVQAGGSGVSADGLRDKAGSELGDTSSDGRAADLEGSRSLNGDTGGGSPQRTDNGGAEHYEIGKQREASLARKEMVMVDGGGGGRR